MKNPWIVIPACNEEKNIIKVIKRSKKFSDNIIVVDDGSKDKTYEMAKRQAIVLKHLVNLGKGAALKTGCDYAVKNNAKIIITIDADCQHDPNDIPKFLNALKEADVIFGYRKLNKDMPFVLKFGNLILTKITKLLYGISLKDTQCGFRAFTSEAYEKIRWRALDYSMESEMIANVGKRKIKYAEVPIDTIYSDIYKGTTILDGIKIAFNMCIWRLSRW